MASMLRLAGFLAPYRWRIAAALAALLVAAGCVLALGQGLKHVVDAASAAASRGCSTRRSARWSAVAALLSVATYFRFYLMMSTGERVVTDLRRAVFDHILGLSPGVLRERRAPAR